MGHTFICVYNAYIFLYVLIIYVGKCMHTDMRVLNYMHTPGVRVFECVFVFVISKKNSDLIYAH